jgi:hypothetical protein
VFCVACEFGLLVMSARGDMSARNEGVLVISVNSDAKFMGSWK